MKFGVTLVLGTILFITAACQQQKYNFVRKQLEADLGGTGASTRLVATFSYDNNFLNVRNIKLDSRQNLMTISSDVVGLLVANIGVDPENPSKKWVARDYQNIYPSGFTADGFFGSNAISGALIASSGGRGTVFMRNDNVPSVALIRPNPLQNSQGQLITDVAYVGTLAIYKNFLYVFKTEGYVNTYRMNNSATTPIELIDTAYYPQGHTCCVTSAEPQEFTDGGKMHVAFGDALITFNIGADGKLVGPSAYINTAIHASYVVADSFYNDIWVYNSSAYTGSTTSSLPEGIYRLENNQFTNYLPLQARTFGVYRRSHVYSYEGDGRISIRRIQDLDI